ncbi:glycosyltransferase [Massilia sp. CF038]|uniref:glycosyltransferase n=1 Tax=Massilia sp. CF038 TaxID=1881045 RepID=UPI000922A7B4|nr:glycosyltransferase [Massilia sp. CF038]SHG61517.1 Glycosyl transferases group 1 [Massilia sp. CF038]
MNQELQQTARNAIASNFNALPIMVVFCHLRWDFVYQRPQHLLSRLAQFYRILVVEEPIFHDGESFLKTYDPCPNLTVIQPHTAVHAHGFHDEQFAALTPLLADLVPAATKPVVWFYTPMALPLLQLFQPSLVVYDCMDELSAFKNAPQQLLERESALLKTADIAFTGGPSLYQAKRARHANTHCFPSSVDVAHFSKALDRTQGHPSQQSLAQPRLGYYGVIDERFDVDLLAAVANARPDWQLVMVGPVVKIDPASLPTNPNIHYMGQAKYEELPAYLAAWQVCLMPFALNESTKFISPTKVLEYMAAELPIVSTDITDVTKPYGHIVSIAHTPEEFVNACEASLAMPAQRQASMREQMRAVVKATSWQSTAERMFQLIKQGQAAKSAVPASKARAAASGVGYAPTMAMDKIIAKHTDADALTTAVGK